LSYGYDVTHPAVEFPRQRALGQSRFCLSHAVWEAGYGYGGGAVLATGFVDGAIRLFALDSDGSDAIKMQDASTVRTPTTVEAVTAGGGDGDPDAPLLVLRGHTGSVQCLSWLVSPSAGTAAAGGGAQQQRQQQQQPTAAGAAAGGKRWLVSGARDGQVRIWDPVPGGRGCVGVLSGHSGGINCLSVCKETGLIATGGDDRTARVYDPATLSCVATLRGHTGYVVSVKITGRLVVSGSADGTARAWWLNPSSNQ
jgi:WD40 repeat protein